MSLFIRYYGSWRMAHEGRCWFMWRDGICMRMRLMKVDNYDSSEDVRALNGCEGNIFHVQLYSARWRHVGVGQGRGPIISSTIVSSHLFPHKPGMDIKHAILSNGWINYICFRKHALRNEGYFLILLFFKAVQKTNMGVGRRGSYSTGTKRSP